ncbi:hypothetical protein [Sphingomonas parapaucimobilis]|uniref:Uncharacterized protein n=1 Tax=Sphingomonas parapaucimobilis NBRC 15100 TaxID=1219049 RepID=A0A0A1W5W8_9SPHN|nr:hypothetical protein [Sphingomonas parapaucimobilis]GAM00738.1 hypothetical protein SP5_035_01400 [Sphingomonas parapaucimobilis NBRC 15100]
MSALFMPRPNDTLSADSSQVLIGDALRDIIGERIEQIDKHGHTPTADDRYETPAELIGAATCYADTAHDQVDGPPSYDPDLAPAEWPWSPQHWRCGDARRNLVKAAALLWAAIDNMDRAERLKAGADDRPMATGTEPCSQYRPIDATTGFARGIADSRTWLVRDGEGNKAAAFWTGDMWVYATDDGPHEQLDFEPTHVLPGRAGRPGFVDFAVA